ncbi:gamma carbonic anhydrase family protein [Pseudonocardia acidicola]|uniref:Gamma carbonic anhydrase family protein n=1 Tax=Pseudonocardia acidicola TaxID=2724939 RepID=A0ABX1SIA5_9PSEU|nr:gamma carbonic anhydrase family protein [Pseudonocardia acidicola]NMI01320.1 gamma carbonic anhydrase family protein [Pseudonocardia acidicola]
MADQPAVVEFHGARPDAHPESWTAPGATLIGRVALGPASSVWYGCVLRADMDSITIGARSNIQDGTVVHADPGFPVTVGERVSVGHRAVLHGCTIADDVLVGMGAVVLNGAVLGAGSLVAAGAVVLEGTTVPPGSLVAGVPAKVRRPLTDDERAATVRNAEAYCALAAAHAEATAG